MARFKKRPPTAPGFYEMRPAGESLENKPRLVLVVDGGPPPFNLGYMTSPDSDVIMIDPDNVAGDDWRPTKRKW